LLEWFAWVASFKWLYFYYLEVALTKVVKYYNILPVINGLGAKVITITGNENSHLAKNSDILISFGNIKEACPFDMIPTTSITVILVLGEQLH